MHAMDYKKQSSRRGASSTGLCVSGPVSELDSHLLRLTRGVGLQLVDRAIQTCPIDTRRGLYSNIVLSVSASYSMSQSLQVVQRDGLLVASAPSPV